MKPVMRLTALIAVGAGLAVSQQIPRPDQLRFPPLGEVTPPMPVEFTLSNGMRVFLLENHELPVISGTALVRTGNLFDPNDKRGLSQVMAEVMRSGGTSAKTGDQLDQDLENVAASVESGMGETSASVSFSGLKETTDLVLDVFKGVLTDPAFRQDKVDLTLNQFRGSIARRNDEAGSIPRRELLSILYGRDTPYGWTIEYEHLNAIKRDDLVAFHKRYYFPKNVMLAVYGDFDTAAMRGKLDTLFRGWTAEQPAVPSFPNVTAAAAPGVYLAAKPDVTQTFLSIGHLGGLLKDKDYPALEVMANILGGGFNSHLFAQIRTKLGYAYSISATWAADYNHPGTFRIGGSTKSPTTVATIRAALAEVEKMRTTEVTQVELDEAKQAVLNSFVFNFDSPSKTLDRTMTYAYQGYPSDFLFQYRKAVESVTRADILRVAKEHLKPEQLTIVAVGNPADFGTALDTLGAVKAIDLTIPEPKQQTSEASGETLAQGKAMLARAQQAVGGADKLAAIKDVWLTGSLKTTPEQGNLTIQATAITLAGGHLRQEQTLPFGKIVIYSDGKSGWLATPQGVQDAPPDAVRQLQGELFRAFPMLLLSDRMEGRTVNAVGANEVEISGSGQVVRIEFDAATGLPAKLKYQDGGMPAEETMSDWRDAAGIKLPFTNAISAGTFTVTEYRINTGATVEELSKKP